MSTPAQEIESYKTTRHRCPHCRRSYANRAYAVKHVGWCQKRQANHGCKTCANFCDPDYDFLTDKYYPPACAEGEDVEANLRVNCLKWEAIF